MAIPKEKLDYLGSLGYTPEQISDIAAQADALTKARSTKGTLVRESTEPEKEVTATATEEVVTETESVQTDPEATSFDKASLLKELTDGLVTVLKPMQEAITALQTENAQLKQALETRLTKELAQTTPKISFGELLSKQLFGTTEAQIDGRSVLAKSAPQETLQKQNSGNITGVPFINNIISKQVAN